jgi:hypothetical protein
MRRIARWTSACTAGVLVMWIAMAVQPAAAQVPRDALLAFGENVKWTAVSNDFAGQRDVWIGAVKSARSPAEVAAQLLVLEAALLSQSVEDSWRARRDGWAAEVQVARTSAAVARGLLELGSATRPSALEPAWRGLRGNWVARLQSVQ